MVSAVRYISLDKHRDTLILIARLALTALFIIFGLKKFGALDGTIAYMTSRGLPFPELSVWVIVVIEAIGGLVVLLGFYTRPIALLFILYTLFTAFIGHHYWTMTGAEQYQNMISFYKNMGIAGGFLLLALTGPGRFSLDRR